MLLVLPPPGLRRGLPVGREPLAVQEDIRMNHCDHNHTTLGEIRALPTGGDGHMLTCHRHYLAEMAYRQMRRRETRPPRDPDAWPEPPWESLTITHPAV